MIAGSSSVWADLLEQQLPDLLELVVETWGTLKGPLRDTREDTVTEAFCRALRHNRTVRDLSFYVDLQLVELDPAEDENIGRLDIAFRPSNILGAPNESIYFCLECKWLNIITNGVKRPKGSEYVKLGMLRFVTGQYANAVKHGGMVGYVLDGNIPSAISNVESNIHRNYKNLLMDMPGTLHQSTIIVDSTSAKETFHYRDGEKQVFRIHHLFFAADNLFELAEG